MSCGSEFSWFYLAFHFVFARRKENIEDFPLTFFLSKKVMRREWGAYLLVLRNGQVLFCFSAGGGGALVIGDTAVFYNDIPLH